MKNSNRQFVLSLLLTLLVAVTSGGTLYAVQKDVSKATPICVGLVVGMIGIAIKEVAARMNLEP